MNYVELLTILMLIVFTSKIIAKITKTVDILWYIILGLIGTQYVFKIEPIILENWSLLGVIFIMFYAGWREDVMKFISSFWKNKWVALTGAIGPFIGGFLAYKLLNFNIQEAIVAGFIFTSTAIPYTVGVLQNLGLHKSLAAKTAISSAVADNLISVFLAIGILPAYALLMSKSGAYISFTDIWMNLFEQVWLIIIAFIIFGILGFFILPDSKMKFDIAIPHKLQKDGFLAKITYFLFKIRKAPGFYKVSQTLSNVHVAIPMTLLLIFGLSWIAEILSLHPAITAYLVGLILHAEMFPVSKKRDIDDEDSIGHKNLGVFFYSMKEWVGPVFFIYLGSQMVIEMSQVKNVIFYAIVAGIIVAFFQFSSAYIAGKKTSGLPKHESILLGFSMLPYDIVAFVVLGIAVSTGLIEANSIFVVSIVSTILFINILTSLLIYLYKPTYLRLNKKYKKQLQSPIK